MNLFKTFDPYRYESFDDIDRAWLAVSCAMNSLNRSIGHDDFYPFVINVYVQAELGFVHDVIHCVRHTAKADEVA